MLILVGNDHLANSRVLEYPDFLVGMAARAHRVPYEWFKPPGSNCRDYRPRRTGPTIAEGLITAAWPGGA